MTLLTVVLFLHVLAAATWLGAAIWVPGDVRRTLALGPPHTAAIARRAGPALGLDLWAGVATLATGMAALGLEGGHPRGGIVVGLLAVLVRLGLLLGGMRPALRRVEAAVAADDLNAAVAPARRLAALGGAGHLLWVIALAGMILPY